MRVVCGAKGINTNAFPSFSHSPDAHPPPVEITQPFLQERRGERGISAVLKSCMC